MRSHGFAVAVTVAAGNDILWIIPCEPARGPSLTRKFLLRTLPLGAYRVEHFIVQYKKFGLVGILARTSAGENVLVEFFFNQNFFSKTMATLFVKCLLR